MVTLGFLLEVLTGRPWPGAGRALSAVVIDSREAKPGSLFVAFAGERSDGHDFVPDAFARGAVAALVERLPDGDYAVIDSTRPVTADADLPDKAICILVSSTLAALHLVASAWRRRFELRLIGVTGSVGKTSTKELAHAVLARRFVTLKSEGNYNNEIGIPLTLLTLGPQHERAVLEMGMYAAGEIALLAEMARPAVGVVTNVGPVHLERLGSIEAIAAAKRELVEALPPAPEGVAVLNRDDERVMAMAGHTSARIFTYGLAGNADLWADEIESMGLDGIRFRLRHGQTALRVQVPLLGRHSVHTSLRAAAVGLIEGLSWEEIVAGLRGLTSQLRLVSSPGPRDSVVLDDTYNSSPESAIAALNLLQELGGRRIAVLGDMLELGAAEEASHRLVGRRARSAADILVAVGPRARWIAEEAISAGMMARQVMTAPDVGAAVPLLREIIEANDFVLVKGSRGVQLDHLVAALAREAVE
jgi:UDP-N-acetylmuramoyl-tripeptide--D-alanyl-D-alanine ligase